MEEKKVTKISLSTFFLILAVIVIFIMGYFIYKFYNEKSTESKKSIELQAQVNSLNGTVGELQGKIGNYTIVDDTIVLNYLFNTGSDAGLTATEGKKTLKINADDSITDSKPDHSSSSSLILKKVSSNEDEENANNVNYLINNYYISNKANS